MRQTFRIAMHLNESRLGFVGDGAVFSSILQTTLLVRRPRTLTDAEAVVLHNQIPSATSGSARQSNLAVHIQLLMKIHTFQMASLLRCDSDIYARARAGPPSNMDAGRNEL